MLIFTVSHQEEACIYHPMFEAKKKKEGLFMDILLSLLDQVFIFLGSSCLDNVFLFFLNQANDILNDSAYMARPITLNCCYT